MSFGGDTSTLKQPEPKAFGVKNERIASNEQARPVPWLCGKQRIGATFISRVFDPLSVAVSQNMGKGHRTTTGWNYYGSFAVLICGGPVDVLYDMLLNGESVYSNKVAIEAVNLTSAAGVATFETANPHGLASGDTVTVTNVFEPEYNGTVEITVTSPTAFTYAVEGAPTTPATAQPNTSILAYAKLPPIRRDDTHSDFADVTIPDYGVMKLYWGTETQEADDYLQTSGVAHPAYRGMCYAVFNRLYFGFQQTSVQNIEFVLGRYPRPSWWAEGGPALDLNDDCSPAAAMADLLQNARCGAGLPDALLDTAGFLAAAEQLEEEGFGISPVMNSSQEISQTLVAGAEYFQGLVTVGLDGRVSLGLARPPEDVDLLPVIGLSAMVNKPRLEPADWTSAPNITHLVFTDRTLDYKENAAAWMDGAAFLNAGQADPATLQRPWVTSHDLAMALAKVAGRAAALPGMTGTVPLRLEAEAFDALAPGALFSFDYAGRNLTGLVFRVTERSIDDPARGEFTIQFKLDRSYLYTMAAPAVAAIEQYAFKSAPKALSALRVLELPAGFCPDGEVALAVLASRADQLQVGANVYLGDNYEA